MIIFQKFNKIISEYLNHMKQSELLKKIPNSTYIICIGIHSIIHIFKIVLNKTKNINITYYLCQKAYYGYLEYIEQMNKTQSLHNLKNLDAITFIYKNVLNELDVQQLNIPSTIMIDNNQIDQSTIDSILLIISFMTQRLLIFSNIFNNENGEQFDNLDNSLWINQIQYISNHLMEKYLLLFMNIDYYDKEYLFDHIMNIKNVLNFDFQEYCDYLIHVYKLLKKMKKIPEKNILQKKYNEYIFLEENKKSLEDLKKEKNIKSIVSIFFS